MRLHPVQVAVLGLALFWTGLLLALLVLHGQPNGPGPVVFQTLF